MGLLVSCLTPTYNRAPNHLHLLGEAVESFLRQRLPQGVRGELIILNDTPGQKLTLGDFPEERLGPIDEEGWSQKSILLFNDMGRGRYATLGEKRNVLCEIAEGELLLPWDDDDISLPGRIAQACKPFAYFNPQRSWWLDRDTLHKNHKHGYCHNASAFSRVAWETVGGYPQTSGNEDALMDGKLRAAFGVNGPVENPADWQYIYCWGRSPHHLSGQADGPPDDPHGPHYKRIGQEPIAQGTFTIVPAWREDYEEMCRRACG